MSLTRKLAWNTGVQLAGKILSTAFGIIIVGLMTRYLGQDGFGIYSTANAFLQIFALLLDLGLNVTLVALLGEHAGDKAYEKRCVSALFTFRLISSVLILLIVAPIITWLSPYPLETKLVIFALDASFFFPALAQVLTGVQQRHLKMHMAAFGDLLGRCVLLAGILFSKSLGWGLVPIVGFVSLGSLANFILNFFATRKYAAIHWNWDPAFWRIALNRSWAVGLSIAFGLIYFKADTLILSLVRSEAEVGIYGAAYRVLEILITVPFMYAGLILPILAKHGADQRHKAFADLVSTSIDVMVMLAAPLIIGTVLLGTRIMSLVAGDAFAASGDILKILVLAVGVIYLNTIFSHAVVAVDAQRRMIPTYIGVAIVTLIAYLLFIPTYGLYAAAWLTVLSETAVGVGSLVVTHRFSPLKFHIKTLLTTCLSGGVMGILIWTLQGLPVIPLVLIGIVTYGACLFLFGAISRATVKEMLAIK